MVDDRIPDPRAARGARARRARRARRAQAARGARRPASARGAAVPRDQLVDAVWGRSRRAAAIGSLQVYVHGLRRALGRDRIETREAATGLPRARRARPRAVRELVERADAPRRRRAGTRPSSCAQALALWRGPPLADLAEHAPAAAGAERSRNAGSQALELRNDAELALGGTTRRRRPGGARRRAAVPRAAPRAADPGALPRRPAEGRARRVPATRATLVEELGVEPAPDCRSSSAPCFVRPRARRARTRDKAGCRRRRHRWSGAARDRGGHGAAARGGSPPGDAHGPGGSGKTRLALAAAEELEPELPRRCRLRRPVRRVGA